MLHPVSKVYRKLLKEHREAHLNKVLNGLWEANSIGYLSQLKGQINALDLMLDDDKLEEFFEGELDEKV